MLWLWLAGVLARLPALGLPLLDTAAGLASQADFLAREQGLALDGHPLLPSLLLAIPVAGPWTPTLVLRLVTAFLGALVAPLTATLARRLGASRQQALLAGLLTLVHPAVVLGAGGVVPSTEGWAVVFVLGGTVLGFSDSVRTRRVAAVCGLAALASHPVGTLYALLPLAQWIRREPSRWWRMAFPLAAMLLLVLAPATLVTAWGPGRWSAGVCVLWAAGVTLVVSLPLLPSGLMGLARVGGWAGRLAQLWMGLALVHVVLVVAGPLASPDGSPGWRVLEIGLSLVPLVAIAAAWGGRQFGRLARILRGTGLAVAMAGSAFLGLGPLHLLVASGSSAPVAELTHRARAMDAAHQTVDARGWIALDVLHGNDAQQVSLRDLVSDQEVWMVQEPTAATRASRHRRLYRFPARGFPPLKHVAVVMRADRPPSRIQTFGGVSIYQQEVVRRFGPYVVLRARRE